ncbi:N5,N10-methylene tetrahydromethanopterin reductase [Gordonia sp. CPCC 205333]|uniref:N5,N10-methylene tetrahydromethanopterin reductase n=1 Tax=Gordonia sp. CPCC 205333 TaxID=3140790 RepID=UPI003AF39881
MASYLALALTGSQVVELAADRDLIDHWDQIDLAFTVLGVDRIESGPAGRPTIEPSVAAAFFAAHTTRARTLFAARAGRDHPYNLARRAASAGLLSDGRTGLIFRGGTYLPPVGSWPVHGPTNRLRGDAIHAVRALEASWPFDAVIGDRDTGIFVLSDRIRRVDLVGSYAITGPLTVPEPRTGPSILAWYDTHGTGEKPAPDIDLVIGGPHGLPIVRAADYPGSGPGVVVADRQLPVRVLLEQVSPLAGLVASAEPPIDLRGALGLAPHASPPLGTPAFDAPRPDLARASEQAVR